MSILTKGYSIGSQVYGGIETLGNLYDQFFGQKEELGRRGKLDEFVAGTNSLAFARSAHFRFRILPSGALSSGMSSFNKEFTPKHLRAVNMLCDSTTLPDVASIPLTGSGGAQFPYDITKDLAYATQSASFYVSEDMFQKKFFDNWLELTYNKDLKQPYYYNDYITTIEIYQLKRTLDDSVLTGDNDWTYKVKLYNAYPKVIAPMTMDWSSANALQKVSVTFHYTHWDSEINSK
jgi:hypothetical protein